MEWDTFVSYQRIDKLAIAAMWDRLFWHKLRPGKAGRNELLFFAALRRLDEEKADEVMVRGGLPNHRAVRKTQGRKTIPDITVRSAAPKFRSRYMACRKCVSVSLLSQLVTVINTNTKEKNVNFIHPPLMSSFWRCHYLQSMWCSLECDPAWFRTI